MDENTYETTDYPQKKNSKPPNAYFPFFLEVNWFCFVLLWRKPLSTTTNAAIYSPQSRKLIFICDRTNVLLKEGNEQK
jgi:hypothetical protein